MRGLKPSFILLSIFAVIVLSGTVIYGQDHQGADCIVCHHYTECNDCPNMKFARCEITTPNSGLKDVAFLANSGANSYADCDSVYDGVCEVCHTQTLYHTNTGSGTTHYDGLNCIPCHRHPDSPGEGDMFFPQVIGPQSHNTHFQDNKGPHLSTCTACHHPDDFTLFADGEPLATTSVCNSCHGSGVAMAKEYWAEGIY